jgi:hypothetical protein
MEAPFPLAEMMVEAGRAVQAVSESTPHPGAYGEYDRERARPVALARTPLRGKHLNRQADGRP